MNIRSVFAGLASLFWKGGGGYPSKDPKNAKFRDGWDPQSSAGDDHLADVLPSLTDEARDIDRRTAKGRGVVDGFRADVVGMGIGIEPTLAPTLARLVTTLRDGFNAWAESAGVNGDSLWTMQWTAAGDVCTAGAFLWRWVKVEGVVGIPLRMLPLEVEWLSPEPLRDVAPDCWACGCEFDTLGRVVAWHLRNPKTNAGEIVPAADIIHGFIPRRARQHLGEPNIAPLILRLLQDDRLVVTELDASANTAAVSGIIKTQDPDLALGGPAGATTAPSPGAPPTAKLRANRRLPPGGTLALLPHESWETVENKRLAQGIGIFRSSMDGDLAAGGNVSRQWIDRDSGRANFSSMREDNLRTSRLLGPMQAALGRAMASRVYERLVPYLLIQAGERWPSSPFDRAALLRHEIRPDRIPYVDPMKEAAADIYQVENNLTTLEAVLASKNLDVDTVLAKRSAEQAKVDAMAMARVKRLADLAKTSGVEGLTWAHLAALAGATSAPGAFLGAAVPDQPSSGMPGNDRAFAGLRLVRDESGEVVEIQPAAAP